MALALSRSAPLSFLSLSASKAFSTLSRTFRRYASASNQSIVLLLFLSWASIASHRSNFRTKESFLPAAAANSFGSNSLSAPAALKNFTRSAA